MGVAVVMACALGWVGLSASFEASVNHGVRLASGATIVATFTVGFCLVGVAARLVRGVGARRVGVGVGVGEAEA